MCTMFMGVINMISVAIDGPSGAGKSTISKTIAKRLGYIYVDTGALYRALGLKLSSMQVDVKDINMIQKVLAQTKVELAYIDGEQRVLLDGNDVSDKIRTPEVSMAASAFSAVPCVRAHLLELQRGMARTHSVIMDGRDIGTVVLPNADVKIFLSASAEARAQRRYDELVLKGLDVKFEDVLADMKQRDYDDSNRAVAPLKKADDATEFDTSDNTFEQSVELLYQFIKSKER